MPQQGDEKLDSGRTAADVLRDSRRKRTKWYELDSPARRAVQIRLPQQGELYDLRTSRSAADVRDLLAQCAIDWRNFTEADILGDQGGDSPVPFSRELFEEWIFDHVTDHMMTLARSVIDDARKRTEHREDAAKNSETS
jgi:hypothetical protein